MTINSKEIALEILRKRGIGEPGEPRLLLAYSYICWSANGMSGEQLFAFFMSPEHDDMAISPYVANPVCLMANGMLTQAGEALINS